MDQFKVVIVGGGLVGSLAAVYFAKRGCIVQVYEQRKDLRKEKGASGRSINLALSARGLAALQGAGVDLEILHKLIPMSGRMIHSKNGALTSQPYGTFGECINSVDRKLINENLLDAAASFPNVSLYFEHALESCHFDDNSLVFRKKSGTVLVEDVDLILGCDGAYSKTRSFLMRQVRMDYAQEYIDHAYLELTMPPKKNEYAMDGSHLHIWPRQSFMMIALPNLDKSFTVTLFMPWADFESLQTKEQVEQFFLSTFPDAVELIGKDELLEQFFKNPRGSLISIKCKPYHYKDKVVILGDAAHAMVPFYGQGMNCGFEDVFVLDQLFEQFQPTTSEKMSAMLETYTRTRYPDATSICDLALNNYIEMRSSVTKWGYLLRKKVESFFHYLFPKTIIPLYTMVSFTLIPYSQVVKRHECQTRWLYRLPFIVGLGIASFALQKYIVSGVACCLRHCK